MPLLGQKKVNSVKTTLYYGRKKSIGCPFLPIFHGKITALMPMLFQKDVHSLKNTLLSCPYFVEKTSILSKTLCSHIIFLTFKWKILCCHAHISSKTHRFCQNYIILWVEKVNRMLFFFRFFTEKTPLSCPYFVKKTSTLEKIHCSQVHILSKNVQSLKNTALMSFFQNFMKIPLLFVKPIFGQNTSILSKLHFIMG